MGAIYEPLPETAKGRFNERSIRIIGILQRESF